MGRRVLVGCALIVYTACLCEAYFRVFDPQPLMPRYVTGTPWGVRGNIPNARYWNHTAEVDVEYRINNEGMRADRDYPLAKPPGTCRVAVFGDSFFFGIELAANETYEGQLEARLRRAGYAAEVLNFAVGGFGTAEMLQTFESYGRRFEPNAVIFSWDDSDLQDNKRAGLYRLDDGRLARANAAYLPGVKTSDWLMRFGAYRFIADHSEFYSFIRERTEFLVKRQLRRADRAAVADAQSDAPVDEGSRNLDPEAAARIANAEQKRRLSELSSAILLRADQAVRAAGAELFLVEIPWKISRTQFTSSVEALPEATRSQLHVVYTAGALGKAARPDLKLYYESGQGHLTPRGMSILVDQTAQQLVGSAALAPCRQGSVTGGFRAAADRR